MTSLALYRTDFAQVGQTNRSCMRVIPVEKKKADNLDRIVVGGTNGCVICVCRKNNETQIIYKTPTGPPIQCICLGGAIGTVPDKVFVSSSNNVKGIGKKGKQFFSFDTTMAETANRMYIYGVDLLLTGAKSYNHYHDCADANYVLSPEEINDVLCLRENSAWSERSPLVAVIACKDATLKVIEQSSIAYEVQLSDVPYSLYLFMGNGGFPKNLVLYGTKNGNLGLASLPAKAGTIKWELRTTTAAAISAITCHRFTGDTNTPNILIGKEDGVIEIYNVDDTDNVQLHGVFQCDESITSLGCGRISSIDHEEIIVCTYTGWLFSLSFSANGKGRLPQATNVNVKVQLLKSEIEELEAKVMEERTRYEELTMKDGNAFAYLPRFQVLDSFEFNPHYGAYNLTIELLIPIDFIIVQSELPVRLVEVEKNASVVCHQPVSETNPWSLLASYRCQQNVNRIELRARIDEGKYGLINVYVAPLIHPKMVQIRRFDVKPLSAHQRVHNFDATRPQNILTFTGNFSLAEAHSWICMILPGIPPKSPTTDVATANFQSAVSGGTQLQITYSKGSLTFKSDSMSTIAIVREKITFETTRKQIKVNISCDLNEASIDTCLQLLHPRMTHLLNLEKRKRLAMALRELESNTDDISFLSEENQQILADHDKIFEDAEKDSLEDSNTSTIYESLLLDRARLNGSNAKSRIPALQELLQKNYSFENVSNFFKDASEEASLR